MEAEMNALLELPSFNALRLVVNLAALRGRRLAFFDVVAAFVHAVIDELVLLLFPCERGQGRTGMLHKALHSTRKASLARSAGGRRLEGLGDIRSWLLGQRHLGGGKQEEPQCSEGALGETA